MSRSSSNAHGPKDANVPQGSTSNWNEGIAHARRQLQLLRDAAQHERGHEYTDDGHIYTILPEFVTDELSVDGYTPCNLTKWMEDRIQSTPGYPQAIDHPPKTQYELRRSPGRGMGLFATEDIEVGALLFAERPLLFQYAWNLPFHGEAHQTYEEKVTGAFMAREKTMEHLFSRMSPENQKKYMSLSNSHKTDGSGPLYGIMRTNGFGVRVGESQDPEGVKLQALNGGCYSAVGHLSSRLNHSCSPSVVFSFNATSFAMEVHTVRPVAKGEELTASYICLMSDLQARRNALRPYGFTCTCTVCKDGRAADMQRVYALTSFLPKTSQGLQNADAALAAYEATGLQSQPRYLELLQRVARINRKAGKKTRADELDALAAKLTVAIHGRSPFKPEPVAKEGQPVIRNEKDLQDYIMSEADPARRQYMIDAVTEAMETMKICEERRREMSQK